MCVPKTWVVNIETNVAFDMFTLGLLLSFHKFATYLPTANLCKSIFSSISARVASGKRVRRGRLGWGKRKM